MGRVGEKVGWPLARSTVSALSAGTGRGAPWFGCLRAQQGPGVRDGSWTQGRIFPPKGHPERLTVQQIMSAVSVGYIPTRVDAVKGISAPQVVLSH